MDTDVLIKVLVLGTLVEATVDTIKLIYVPEKRTADKWITLAVGFLLAIGVNWLAGLDIFEAVGVPLKYQAVSIVLTGLILSRGSNYIHDVFKVVFLWKARMEQTIQADTTSNREGVLRP